jgi:hypothetical protein
MAISKAKCQMILLGAPARSEPDFGFLSARNAADWRPPLRNPLGRLKTRSAIERYKWLVGVDKCPSHNHKHTPGTDLRDGARLIRLSRWTSAFRDVG